MDKLIINHAKFRCNVGVTDKERGRRQNIFVDVELFFDHDLVTFKNLDKGNRKNDEGAIVEQVGFE